MVYSKDESVYALNIRFVMRNKSKIIHFYVFGNEISKHCIVCAL